MHPGDLIEGFEIAELAGSGGMARVYRGREQQTGRAVALKLLGSGDHSDKKRFAREVRVLSELRHPGIVRYFAHGLTVGGKPYLVMEWLAGEDLKAHLDREHEDAPRRRPAPSVHHLVPRARALDTIGSARLILL